MKKLFLSLATCALLFSCTGSQKSADDIIDIDYSLAQDYTLDDLTDDVKIVKLEQDGGLFSNPASVRAYGDYIFIHEGDTQKLYLYDSDFNYLNVLDAVGRGPREYIEINSYTYDADRKVLSICDGFSQTIKDYSIPSMEHIKSIKYDETIYTIEYVDEGLVFLLKEMGADEAEGSAMQLVDISGDSLKVVKSDDVPYLSAASSIQSTITRLNDKVYYCFPSVVNEIYLITPDGFEKQFGISFGERGIPKEIWDNGVEGMMELLGGDQQELLGVSNFVIDKDKFSTTFILVNGMVQKEFVQDKSGSKVINSINLRDIEGVKIKSLGVVDGYSTAFIHSGSIEQKETNSKISKQIMGAADNEDAGVLVMYKL